MANKTPERYDELVEYTSAGIADMSTEEILMNEKQLLAGLLELGSRKDEEASYKTVSIRRGGVKKIEFRIRPLSESEIIQCRENATKYAPRKANQPRVAIDTNEALVRAWIIYSATVDNDRAKLWDNNEAKKALGVYRGEEMIDAVLLAGEKLEVLEQIMSISGYDDEATMLETAKN